MPGTVSNASNTRCNPSYFSSFCYLDLKKKRGTKCKRKYRRVLQKENQETLQPSTLLSSPLYFPFCSIPLSSSWASGCRQMSQPILQLKQPPQLLMAGTARLYGLIVKLCQLLACIPFRFGQNNLNPPKFVESSLHIVTQEAEWLSMDLNLDLKFNSLTQWLLNCELWLLGEPTMRTVESLQNKKQKQE